MRQGVAVEGHPDNVAPCVLGGIVIAALDGEEVAWARVEPPRDLAAVVAIPDFPLPTSQSRSVLPERIERRDAIFNAGRVGLLVAALQQGDYSLLRIGMQDRLHQPYRMGLVPGMEAVLAAATEAGALGAALSGAGPTALALVTGRSAEVADAMQQAWAKEGIAARTLVLGLVAEGRSMREREVNMASEAALIDDMTTPMPEVVEAVRQLDGPILLLGVSGKMGPSLAELLVRAGAQQVVGVARFTDAAKSGATWRTSACKLSPATCSPTRC